MASHFQWQEQFDYILYKRSSESYRKDKNKKKKHKIYNISSEYIDHFDNQ